MSLCRRCWRWGVACAAHLTVTRLQEWQEYACSGRRPLWLFPRGRACWVFGCSLAGGDALGYAGVQREEGNADDEHPARAHHLRRQEPGRSKLETAEAEAEAEEPAPRPSGKDEADGNPSASSSENKPSGWLARIFGGTGAAKPRAPQIHLDDGEEKLAYDKEHDAWLPVDPTQRAAALAKRKEQLAPPPLVNPAKPAPVPSSPQTSRRVAPRGEGPSPVTVGGARVTGAAQPSREITRVPAGTASGLVDPMAAFDQVRAVLRGKLRGMGRGGLALSWICAAGCRRRPAARVGTRGASGPTTRPRPALLRREWLGVGEPGRLLCRGPEPRRGGPAAVRRLRH